MPYVTSLVDEQRQSLEYDWVGSHDSSTTIVFLHEGLGSVSSWGRFPAQLCDTLQVRGLVYSRYGYGCSSERLSGTVLAPNYHQEEAESVLPGLLNTLGVGSCFLFGHSDGATIALLAATYQPERYQGLIVLAPHIFVEDVTVKGVREARQAYEIGGLRSRIERHHVNVDTVFYAWNDIWLSVAFRDWNIEEQMRQIRCPVLAIQGADDEYATMEQMRGMRRQMPELTVLEIPECGHWPHRDVASLVIEATKAFLSA